MQLGSQKTVLGCALFSDLSMLWYSVAFNIAQASDPSRTQRQARYSPRPEPQSHDQLVAANASYGEVIAQYAEAAEQAQQPAGRGECWDLANEAIKSCSEFDVPQPVPSISRTHGHLIYEGKAWGKAASQQTGRWRGHDVMIRRGDIVEWRRVKIRESGAPAGSWSTLGDPDRTYALSQQS